MEIINISILIELIGIILMVVAVILMIRIAELTGWFKAWYILSCAMVLIVARRIITAYAPYTDIKILLGQINSILLLVISILFVSGYYMLYKIFKKRSMFRQKGNK